MGRLRACLEGGRGRGARGRPKVSLREKPRGKPTVSLSGRPRVGLGVRPKGKLGVGLRVRPRGRPKESRKGKE